MAANSKMQSAPAASSSLCVGSILVTSREALHLRGDYDYPVPTMSLPDISTTEYDAESLSSLSQYEAVRMFIDRAEAIQHSFEITKENAPAVAEICHRLDGLPLAIELAAASIRMLPPQKMLLRMQNRLPLSTHGASDLPARQQTLKGAIAWSYDLLEEEERALFRRLGVFAGGCTLEAAEDVCGIVANVKIDVFTMLSSLEEKNLVRQEEHEGEPRFVMLETVRLYALERLAESGEEAPVRRSHTEHFLAMAEKAEPHLYLLEDLVWLRRLEAEHNNLRAALRWTLGGRAADLGLRLASALMFFWFNLCLISEGRTWLEEALRRSNDSDSAIRARVLSRIGFLMEFFITTDFRDMDRAKELIEEGLSLLRKAEDLEGLAESLCHLAIWNQRFGDSQKAIELFQECLALSKQIGFKWGIIHAQGFIGQIALVDGDTERATAFFEETLALLRQTGSWLKTWSRKWLGIVAIDLEDYQRAMILFRESLSEYREIGYKKGVADTLCLLAHAAMNQTNFDEAKMLLKEGMVLSRENGFRIEIGGHLAAFAELALAQNQEERAIRLFASAEALREVINIDYSLEFPYKVDFSRHSLYEAEFKALWGEGRAMSLDQAINYALSDDE